MNHDALDFNLNLFRTFLGFHIPMAKAGYLEFDSPLADL